jgi:hypothetical protein
MYYFLIDLVDDPLSKYPVKNKYKIAIKTIKKNTIKTVVGLSIYILYIYLIYIK